MAKGPSLLTSQLVACVDGPLVGQWFYLEEWRARLASARHMLELNGTPQPVLAYSRPSPGDMVAHPQFDDVAGMAVRVAP